MYQKVSINNKLADTHLHSFTSLTKNIYSFSCRSDVVRKIKKQKGIVVLSTSKEMKFTEEQMVQVE